MDDDDDDQAVVTLSARNHLHIIQMKENLSCTQSILLLDNDGNTTLPR